MSKFCFWMISGLIASVIPVESWRVIFICGGIAPIVVAPLLILFLPQVARASQDKAASLFVKRNPLRDLFAEGRATRTLSIWLAFLLIVLILHLLLNWLPLLLMGKGLTKGFAGIAQAAFNIGSLLALAVGATLDTKWRRLGITATVAALPAVLILLARAPGTAQWSIALAFFMGGASVFVASPVASSRMRFASWFRSSLLERVGMVCQD